ncbi:hypothetical protein P167DRAFT_563882 [Morchella conica CCBAS932]|uniref:Uncharacterized protein n=1 Tax=Morchella conica CCBAS932 TaxID=1392247 RepID=A0A3N4KY74_9PEZI|nr:hypothetical protein P167DRAFT_563882 [Morchella conica CCBAS932]
MWLLTGLAASSLVTLAASKLNNVAAHLSPQETRLLLVERLGVSRFHELNLQGTNVRKTYPDMSLFEEREATGMFIESPRKGNFILSLAGMIDNQLDPELSSTIIIDDSSNPNEDTPTASSVANLLSCLATEKAELSGLHKNTFSDGLCVSIPKLEELARFEAVLNKDGFPTRLPEDLQQLTSTLDPTEESQSRFLAEFTMIRRFMEVVLPGLPEDGMAYCHAPQLDAFIAAKGTKSAEAKVAEALYSYLLRHTPSSIKSTILLLPQSSEASHAKREEKPLSIIQPSPSSSSSLDSNFDTTPNSAKQILGSGLIARCHSTKDACESSTANCSGRGTCTKAIQAGSNSCWTCSCNPPVRKDGVKTTTWAGAACQKKDISVPFNMFLVFGIVITFVLIAAINLLYGIGDEPLPSVLSAGVVPAKHN